MTEIANNGNLNYESTGVLISSKEHNKVAASMTSRAGSFQNSFRDG